MIYYRTAVCSLLLIASVAQEDLGERGQQRQRSLYPRVSELGERLLTWLRENGGVAHARVEEIAPGHRIMVIDKDIDPGTDILTVPPELCIHPSSSQVQQLQLVQDALNMKDNATNTDFNNAWAMQTYIMWASIIPPPGEPLQQRSNLDPYFASLPTYDDYAGQCRWSPLELAELHMQPWEPGMPELKLDQLPFPTPSSPGLVWDNGYAWQQWQSATKRVMAAHGWEESNTSSTAQVSLLKERWNIPPSFVEGRKRFAWAKMVLSSRAWSGQQLWPVLDMTDSNLGEFAAFDVEIDTEQGGKLRAPLYRRGQSTKAAIVNKGTELFTIPNPSPNVAMLRSSCHVFENNPHEFVMLDVEVESSLLQHNKEWAQIFQSLQQDTQPYENPHPMDSLSHNARINLYVTPSREPKQSLRATVRLFRQSVTMLLSLARALVWKDTVEAFVQIGERGRVPIVDSELESRALQLAEGILGRRIQQFPTSLDHDRILMQEIMKIQSLELADRADEALKLAMSGILEGYQRTFRTFAAREKLRTALVFRVFSKKKSSKQIYDPSAF